MIRVIKVINVIDVIDVIGVIEAIYCAGAPLRVSPKTPGEVVGDARVEAASTEHR